LLRIDVVVAPLSGVDKMQEALDGELKRLRVLGPSKSDIERALGVLRRQHFEILQSSEALARRLGHYELSFGDATLFFQELAHFEKLEEKDVRAAAAVHLQDTKRTIVEVYPPGWVQDEAPEFITRTYLVRPGDNLILIAKKLGSSVDDIARANGIDPKKPIYPGQRLKVPVTGRPPPKPKIYVVKKGDSLSMIAKRQKSSVNGIIKANSLNPKKPLQIGQRLVIPLADLSPTQAVSGAKAKTRAKSPPPKRSKKAAPRSQKKKKK
jgi:LysM repeat protein